MKKDDQSSLVTVLIVCACIYAICAVWKWESEREFRQMYHRVQEAR